MTDSDETSPKIAALDSDVGPRVPHIDRGRNSSVEGVGLSGVLGGAALVAPIEDVVVEMATTTPAGDAVNISDPTPSPECATPSANRPARTTVKTSSKASIARVHRKTAERDETRSPRPAKQRSESKAPGKSAKPALVDSNLNDTKENIMDMNSSEFVTEAKLTASKVQNAAKDAIQKTAASLGQFAGFTKGNSEAIVESGKIVGAGLNELANGYKADGRAALELLKSDAKDFAAIRSPADIFKFQANILGRNIGLALEYGSKNSEAILKLAKEAGAPLYDRAAKAAALLQNAG